MNSEKIISAIIYKITCIDENKSYIGQTRNYIKNTKMINNISQVMV